MMQPETVTFTSGRSEVTGHLYRPDAADTPPVVVMAHGFAARQNWGLPPFAERFAERGIAALTFDYRGFGESGGGPRRVVSAEKQRADYRSAMDFVRGRDDLDADALALWGMSYSGGHVIALAANEDVEAAVATVPFTDGLHVAAHAIQHGGVDYLRGMTVGLAKDARQILLRRDPHTLRVVPDPENDAFAVLATPGSRTGYESMIPEADEDWPNRTAARVLFEIPFNRPVTAAAEVDVPVFVLEATDDQIVPQGAVNRLVDELDDVHRVRVPAGHFESLVGAVSTEVANRQADFLQAHLDTGPDGNRKESV
jgi:pimeloyl-ACP methyl ester carboxylesterase